MWALVASALLSLMSCKASRVLSAKVGPLESLPPFWGRVEGGRGASAAAAQVRGGGKGGRSSSSSSSKQDKDGQRETLYDAYNMLHTLAQVRLEASHTRERKGIHVWDSIWRQQGRVPLNVNYTAAGAPTKRCCCVPPTFSRRGTSPAGTPTKCPLKSSFL